MSYLYEDDDNEFTSCCGAFSKGCDGYIGCRGCYQEIEEYFSNKKSFRKLIENKTLLAEFDNLLGGES
jgi:hypothetical protein|tara:strand:+ start:1814 stop:2017 length:204 start_codon:yes stop_codon:yes gene_type:complete